MTHYVVVQTDYAPVSRVRRHYGERRRNESARHCLSRDNGGIVGITRWRLGCIIIEYVTRTRATNKCHVIATRLSIIYYGVYVG